MKNRHRRAVCVAFALTAAAALPAMAVQFPVTGTLTINGEAQALPAGASFGDSSYDPALGYLSSGQFSFPQASTSSSPLPGTTLTVTYQVSQTDSSTAAVDSQGIAAMTTATFKLHIVSVTCTGGFCPPSIDVGTSCDFEPIVWGTLGGTASAGGMDLQQASFEVPPTTDSCGGYQSQINDALVGNTNSADLHLAGDFTPPTDSIFEDGFELP